MFGDIHYVPLLRSKPGELKALSELPAEVRRFITPIVEFLPRTFAECASQADVETKLDELADHFTSWKGQRVILDFSPLNWDYHPLREAGLHPINGLFERLRKSGSWPVPLITLKMAPGSLCGQSIAGLLKRHSMGACLRISPAELSVSEGVQTMVDRALGAFQLYETH